MSFQARHTKIIATLGPSTSSAKSIEALARAGVNVFRLNFSHGSHEEHKCRYDMIRQVETKLSYPLTVLADLQGPKLRVGTFQSPAIFLQNEQEVFLELSSESSSENVIPIPHPEIFVAIKEEEDLLLDDGKIRLRIIDIDQKKAKAKVILGGYLTHKKGINVPGVILPISAVTEKDKADLDFALGLGVDWVALSFVQSAADIEQAQNLIQGRARIIAKIEKPKALDEINDIIEKSDAIMIARGDLGVEIPVEKVPIIQRRLITLCRKTHKPVIVATQMLESMVKSPVPTRAEVTDVANAVYEGVDAVMLSAESASGDFPVEAVLTMRNVIANVERDPIYRDLSSRYQSAIPTSERDAFLSATRQIAESTGSKAIIVYSASGATALSAAGSRPHVPVIVLTPQVKTARQLNLLWGLYPIVSEDVTNFREMVTHACDCILEYGLAALHDSVVITAGVPFGKPGSPNILRLITIGNSESYGA